MLLKFVLTVYLSIRCFIMVNRLVCMSGLLLLLLIGRHSAGAIRIHRKTTAVINEPTGIVQRYMTHNDRQEERKGVPNTTCN